MRNKSIRGWMALWIGAVALSGCTGAAFERAERTGAPSGSSFQTALHAGYLRQAREARQRGDTAASDRLARHAIAAASNRDVAPQAIDARRLTESEAGGLIPARARLVHAQEQLRSRPYGVADPGIFAISARAQVMFDCWVYAPGDGGACRAGFDRAVAKLEDGIRPRVAASGERVTFIVHFAAGDAALDVLAEAVVAEAEAAARALGAARVTMLGKTGKRAGGAEGPLLATFRAKAVAKAMVARGISDATIGLIPASSAAPVANGVPTDQDTSVEILISP